MKNALAYYDNKLITVVKKFDSEGLWRQIHLFAKSGKSAVSQVKKTRAFHDKLGRFDLNQAPSSFTPKNDLADCGNLLNVVLKLLDVFTSGFDREVRQTHFLQLSYRCHDIQHNNTQHKGSICDTQHKRLSA